jgi:LPXTG-motif cell wall-anchored protein
MTGFEDMVTENGEVYICGGDSGRTINPGANGSVYFLTETQAPLTYTKLADDIVFRISPIGVPSLISDSYNGQLVETEDSYIYTLSVPNTKEEEDRKLLTIKKTVQGNEVDTNREFTFTLTVDSADPDDGFVWMKNTVTQNTELHSGDTFTLKHGDEVVIAVPAQVDLTVTEENGEYTPSFKFDDDEPQNTNTLMFSITDDATLEVVNTFGMIVPTGVINNIILSVLIALMVLACIGFILWKRKRSTGDF